LSTLNLLRSDQSTLTIEQWNLLSNLSHFYDEHSGVTLDERFMNEQMSLPPKLCLKSGALIRYFNDSMEGTQLLYKNNQDFLSLSANNRSVLLNNTIKYITDLSTNFICHLIVL
ncbi:unnamed protein product, partial [Rotaria sp. Silwood1]